MVKRASGINTNDAVLRILAFSAAHAAPSNPTNRTKNDNQRGAIVATQRLSLRHSAGEKGG